MGWRDCCCWECLEKGSSSDISSSSREEHPPIVTLTYIASVIHGILGLMSFVLGVLSSQEAEVWMAHRVSPIWSGVFYLLTAIIGVITARKRTAYLVMCFGALCVVSMVVGVVCIQLLKRGLVTHLSDGATYKRDDLEMNVILALATSGLEILVCIATFPVCCQMAAKVKEEVHMKRDGTFSIQVLGDKDIVIQQSDSPIYERLCEDDTVSDLAKLAIQGECSGLLIATSKLNSSNKKSIKKSEAANNHRSVSKTVSDQSSVSQMASNHQSVSRMNSDHQSVSSMATDNHQSATTTRNHESVSKTASGSQSESGIDGIKKANKQDKIKSVLEEAESNAHDKLLDDNLYNMSGVVVV